MPIPEAMRKKFEARRAAQKEIEKKKAEEKTQEEVHTSAPEEGTETIKVVEDGKPESEAVEVPLTKPTRGAAAFTSIKKAIKHLKLADKKSASLFKFIPQDAEGLAEQYVVASNKDQVAHEILKQVFEKLEADFTIRQIPREDLFDEIMDLLD